MKLAKGVSMNSSARVLVCALALAGCFKRGARESDNSEAPTQVQTTVPDAGAAPVMPAPVAPIPVAPVAVGDAGAVPVMPVAVGPNALDAGTGAVAPGAAEPSTAPPAAPTPPPTVAQPAAPAQPTAAQPTTAQPSTNNGTNARTTEVLNVPGVGPVRVRQGRDTTVNVGGIRINIPGAQ